MKKTDQIELPIEETNKKTLPTGSKFYMPEIGKDSIVLGCKEPSQDEIDKEMSRIDETNTTIDLSRIGKDICCVYTTPRLTFSDNMFCSMKALTALGITSNWSAGVFWEQCMSRLIGKAIDSGYKYVLTLDYDSVFTKEDIIQLYVLMENNIIIDALCPLQLRRGDGEPLASFIDESGNKMLIVTKKVFELDMIPVATAHFGLTLIKTDKLMKVKKPWFMAQPNLQGDWEDGKIDSDITFWKNWRDAGNTVYLTPSVHVGHIEFMVTWADEMMQPIHQHIGNYNEKGKPDHTMGKKLIELGG